MTPARLRCGLRPTTALWLAFAVVGCGTPQPNPPAATASLGASLAASLPPTASPSAVASSSLANASSSAPAVTVDPGLLEVFPAAVDGLTLEPDPTTAGQIASDPLLAESAVSIAVAVAVAPGASDAGGSGDLAVASVVRLRPDVFDEAFYQEWRDTYDDAACEVADGVLSDSETTIAGRKVYEARCAGGAETFHTYLEDQGFIVSITGTGERRLGERIMAGLAG